MSLQQHRQLASSPKYRPLPKFNSHAELSALEIKEMLPPNDLRYKGFKLSLNSSSGNRDEDSDVIGLSPDQKFYIWDLIPVALELLDKKFFKNPSHPFYQKSDKLH